MTDSELQLLDLADLQLIDLGDDQAEGRHDRFAYAVVRASNAEREQRRLAAQLAAAQNELAAARTQNLALATALLALNGDRS